jgi:hypothetical protein
MTYGLQIFASDGTTKTFDSTTAAGGCIVDIVPLIPNSGSFFVYNTGTQTGTQVKSYPDYPGKVAFVVLLSGDSRYYPDTTNWDTYPYGYPIVTFPPLTHYTSDTLPEVYMVFIS